MSTVTPRRISYISNQWRCVLSRQDACLITHASLTVASRSQRVSLIVIPFCLSVCLSVIPRPTAYHDWSITTKFGRQVYTCPRTCVSLFGSLSPILSVPEGKICKILPISKANVMHRAIWFVYISSWSKKDISHTTIPCYLAPKLPSTIESLVIIDNT